MLKNIWTIWLLVVLISICFYSMLTFDILILKYNYVGPEASTAYLGHVVCIPSDPCGQWARRHGARNQWGRGKDFSASKWSCSRAVEVITYVLIQNQLIF